MNNVTTSSASQIVRDAFNFSVDKFPLSGPDNMKTPFYGLFRSDNQSVVSDRAVTARYVPHTTDDVCAIVEAAESAFDCNADVKCHFRMGHYVDIAPNADMRRSIYGTADNVFPRIIVSAGYDGKSFRATMGYYRDLCQNLAMMTRVSGTCVSIRHSSNLRSHMDQLIADFTELGQSWDNLTDTIARMQARTTDLTEFLNAVYGQPEADTGRGATIHRNRTKEIFDRVTRERAMSGRPYMNGNYGVSMWEAFNAVQGYEQHCATRRSSFNNDFDRIIKANFGTSAKPVREAERLALSA
jgi:hypothetical protein